ncbi:MFS transporter [Microbacterium tenebrionis]|uniref:MFS transporter n=1 Tax=Microbacterium tenebrionis TaxID=2830665 RepID=UPI00158B4982|nr:MFS transporter [Microbacterium ihumii]
MLLGFLALPMSMSGAGVAVPRIGSDLDASGPAAQWVVTAYFLTASSFMLVAGSLGDAIGRRRIYRAGAIAYTLGCVGAALAPNIAVLLAARVLTGLGAAGVMAGGGAILGATFTGAARARAFAAMGTISGLGLALGPSLSGWLVDGLGWRLGFGAFVLPGLILIAGTLLMHETRAETTPRIDVAGAAAFIAGLAALMVAVTQGSSLGWTSPAVLLLLACVALLLTAFVVIERRAANPILNLALLRRRGFMGWLLAAITMSAGFGGVLNFLPSYLQDPVGLTAANAGLVLMLPTLPMMIMPAVGGWLVSKGTSPVLVITAALLAIAGGNALLATLHPATTPLDLAWPLVLLGAGVGLASGIIDAQAMNEVSEKQVGMAAGMLNTVRGTSNALVLGLFGSALITILTGKIGSAELAGQVATGNLPNTADAEFLAWQLTDTWRIVLIALAILCVVAAIATNALVRRPRHR